ncbi:hypothetical protein PybrP1_002128 [[Pythium] brassicae (nom. inval.)]|nr:hypothetical protein PybrP1_002128 [[Pythium] brassicae (nom. inval.)]
MDTNNLLALDDENDDVAPELLFDTAFNPQVLPRFSYRRTGSNLSVDDSASLASRPPSVYDHAGSGPSSKLLAKTDLASADALLAGGVNAMNATLTAAVEEVLGAPIPSLEVRFRDVRITARVAQAAAPGGKIEVPSLLSPLRRELARTRPLAGPVPFLAADFAERFRNSDVFQHTLAHLACPVPAELEDQDVYVAAPETPTVSEHAPPMHAFPAGSGGQRSSGIVSGSTVTIPMSAPHAVMTLP